MPPYATDYVVWMTLASLVAAAVSSMLGNAGGAMLLAIMFVSGMPPAIALPVHAVTQLIANIARTQAFLKWVVWRGFGWFGGAAVPGTLIGVWLNWQGFLDESAVKLMLGVIVVYATWAPRWGVQQLSDRAAYATAGMICGALGVIVGAVGPVLAPFFLRPDQQKEQIIATAAVSMAWIHILKLCAFGIGGFDAIDHIAILIPMTGAVIAGTWLGKWLLMKFSERVFRWMFRVVLTVLGAQLVVQGISGLVHAA